MASRRMFSLDVVDTDKFLEMPTSTQALYFQLGMRADDDGFVSSPKRITSLVGASPDDLKLLIAKEFVIVFQSGVVVLSHWRQNNYVRCDRYTKTIHTDEMKLLSLENGIYHIGIPNGIPNDIPAVSTDKNRPDKNRADSISCSEPDQSAPNSSGLQLPLTDNSFYDIPSDRIEMWRATYPAVDVQQEIMRMIAWAYSNPTKRKTRRGAERFINSWLSRAQDSGGNRNGGEQEVKRSGSGNYDSYSEWERVARIIRDTPGTLEGRKDLPF